MRTALNGHRCVLQISLAWIVLGWSGWTCDASVIVWTSPSNIVGDSDVSTRGTLVGAFNLAESSISTTVNGVPFAGFSAPTNATSATLGDFFLGGGTFASVDSTYGSPLVPFANLSANYQTLLQSGTSTAFVPESFTLRISNLTVGESYEFQWWSNISKFFNATETTATAGNSVALLSTTTFVPGGIGQFAIGSFTADSTFQDILFTGRQTLNLPIITGTAINAFQLRHIPTVSDDPVVPEASSLAIWSVLGLAGLAGYRTRSGRRSASSGE